jgi:hypothetical protein
VGIRVQRQGVSKIVALPSLREIGRDGRKGRLDIPDMSVLVTAWLLLSRPFLPFTLPLLQEPFLITRHIRSSSPVNMERTERKQKLPVISFKATHLVYN